MLIAVFPEQPSEALTEALLAAGYRPVPVSDAAEIADRSPPEGWSGLVAELAEHPERSLAVARRARADLCLPVLVVADRSQTGALGLEDFDDFVLSPLDRAELEVRLRRLGATIPSDPADEMIRFKDLELNLATYQAVVAGRPKDLTFMEYELLRFFVTNPGRVWSREQLLSRVWGYDYFGGSRTVDVHVRRLRSKLGEERASWITTVRSVGYRFG